MFVWQERLAMSQWPSGVLKLSHTGSDRQRGVPLRKYDNTSLVLMTWMADKILPLTLLTKINNHCYDQISTLTEEDIVWKTRRLHFSFTNNLVTSTESVKLTSVTTYCPNWWINISSSSQNFKTAFWRQKIFWKRSQYFSTASRDRLIISLADNWLRYLSFLCISIGLF